MKNVDDLLDAAKKITGSDYKTAKDIGVANQLIGNWRGRRGMPSNKHIILLCELSKVDLAEAILAVEYSRENERPLREAGFIDLNMMMGVASLSLVGVGGMLYSPALAGLTAIGCGAIYIIRSKYNKTSE